MANDFLELSTYVYFVRQPRTLEHTSSIGTRSKYV